MVASSPGLNTERDTGGAVRFDESRSETRRSHDVPGSEIEQSKSDQPDHTWSHLTLPLTLSGGGGAQRHHSMVLLGHLIEFFESRAILGLPFRESIRAASVYDSRGRTRAGELCVLGEDEESVLLHKDSVSKQILP